jgi:hypothetical protein
MQALRLVNAHLLPSSLLFDLTTLILLQKFLTAKLSAPPLTHRILQGPLPFNIPHLPITTTQKRLRSSTTRPILRHELNNTLRKTVCVLLPACNANILGIDHACRSQSVQAVNIDVGTVADRWRANEGSSGVDAEDGGLACGVVGCGIVG